MSQVALSLWLLVNLIKLAEIGLTASAPVETD